MRWSSFIIELCSICSTLRLQQGSKLWQNIKQPFLNLEYRKSTDALSSLTVKVSHMSKNYLSNENQAGVQNTGSSINTQQKGVNKIIKHSSYSSASMKNDIMLVKLRFTYSDSVIWLNPTLVPTLLLITMQQRFNYPRRQLQPNIRYVAGAIMARIAIQKN